MVSRLWYPSSLLDTIFKPILILQHAVVLIFITYGIFLQSYFFEVCVKVHLYLKSVKGKAHPIYYNVETEKKHYLCMLLERKQCEK